MTYDVTIDRDKYIGGSDLPAIFGISPFKTRWQLLLEKAEPTAQHGGGNHITTREIEYGNTMEPKIRDFVNKTESTEYEPDQRIEDDLRANVDGWDGKSILEIKTTSQIKETLPEYKRYLVQLLFYMMIYDTKDGVLAVYERPEDFDEDFDENRLELFYVDRDKYKDLCDEIVAKIEKFREDLERVRENPLLTEEDLQPKAVIEAAKWVVRVEQQLQFYKRVEQEAKAAKELLKREMDKANIKSWITDGGVKITNVPNGEDKMVRELDVEGLKMDLPELFRDAEDGGYMVEKLKKGRSGYVRITLP